jgi:hypothetical protein
MCHYSTAYRRTQFEFMHLGSGRRALPVNDAFGDTRLPRVNLKSFLLRVYLPYVELLIDFVARLRVVGRALWRL